jgi:S1-C subfamily serine protease
MSRFLPLLLIVFLAACHGLTVQRHDLKPFPEIPEDAQPAPIGFNKIKYGVPTGSPLAATSPKGLFGLFMCGSPYDDMRSSTIQRHFKDTKIKDMFVSTLEGQGYDVTGNPGRLFDEGEDMQRTVYAVGAHVTMLRLDLCNRRSFWFGRPRGYSGEAEMGIEWSVYDMLHRKNVLKTSTKGYSKLSLPNYEGIELLIEDAFASAAHNLGADKKFRNLVVMGEEPDKLPETIQDINEAPEGLYDPNEKVSLKNIPLSKKPAKGRLEDIRDAAVMIQSGSGHGSGFFITEEGHILTNAHVVGNAFRVRVVTSGKKDKLIAEVLRVHLHRDVALLRLEEVPEDINLRVLPIRPERPEVGEEIYAIGAPWYYYLQDTVTGGIVSAVRYNRYKKLWFIQGDVTIQGGSSGGPLIDENGNVIGMAVSAYAQEDDKIRASSGLNNFIPIADALERLEIAIE